MLAKQQKNRLGTWASNSLTNGVGRLANRASWLANRASRLGPGGFVLTACGLGLLSLSLGCSICPSPYDYDYGTYGTKTPRSDMRNGRVGSVFSDPALTGQASEGMAAEHMHGNYLPGDYLPGNYLPGDGYGVTNGVVGEFEWGGDGVPVMPGETVHGQIIIE